MSETGWPPGPWRAQFFRVRAEVLDADGGWICETRTHRSGLPPKEIPGRRAAVHLIVAASALAEALLPLAALGSDLNPTVPDDKPLYAIGTGRAITAGDIRAASAALAAARGESTPPAKGDEHG